MNMNFCFRSGLLVSFLLHSFFVLGQTPTNAQEYDAWKQALAQTPDPVIITPEMLDIPPTGMRDICECWVEPDASYITINNNSQWNAGGFNSGDDGSHGPLALPFNFQLYGQNHSSAYININGNVSFGDPYGTFSASGFPVPNFAMVAPFWADVDLRGPGAGNNIVRYKITPTAMYVNWMRVGYYNSQTDKVNTFQLIITNGTDPAISNGANVSFCYGDMQWTTGSASNGTNGFGGTPANVGANRGNGVDYLQFGRFDQPGLAYDGPFGANDGVDWLDEKYFSFATNFTSANVPPIISSQSICDSMVLCVGELATLEMLFLSPEPSQTTVASSNAPTLSNYTIVTNTSGLQAQIITEFTPQLSDVGFHEVTFTATDNGSPIMTTTYTVVVEVQMGLVLDTIDHATCSNLPPFAMLPLLPGMPSGGTWTAPSGATHSGTFNPAVDPPGTYGYLSNGGSNCPSLGALTISVLQAPSPGTDGSLELCSSDAPTDLVPLLGGGQSPGGFWIGPSVIPFMGVLDPSQHPSGAYSYIVLGTAPCLNDTAVIQVTVNQAVDPGEPTSITLCTDALPMDLLGAMNGTPDAGGTWLDPDGLPSNGTFQATIDPVGTYTYSLSGTAPCPTLTATLTISVQLEPRAGTDTSLVRCADASPIVLFDLLDGGPDQNGTWQDPAQGYHNGSLEPTADLSGDYLYIVPGTGQCSHLIDTAVVAVTIDPLPEVSFTYDPAIGCIPLDITFTNTTPTQYLGGTTTWSMGDGTESNLEGVVEHTYEIPGQFDVTLTVTTPQGCTDQYTVLQAVWAERRPEAAFSFTPSPGTEGNSLVNFYAVDELATAFNWTREGVVFSNDRSSEQLFMDKLGGDYEVCLWVEDRHGCEDTQCEIVSIVVPSIFVPNAFTPDGDGLNDVFLPVALDVTPGEYRFEVYDRWGQLVFGTDIIGIGWNGRHANGGEILPQGVYVWRMETLSMFTSDRRESKGTITLIK
jgi:gliding motility-associated-like protein